MTHDAIRELYPNAVTINGDGDNIQCFDVNGNELDLDLSVVPNMTKSQKTTEINNNNPAYNPVTLTVNGQSITFNGGDASASAIAGAVDLAQKLGETNVKLWDIENVMRDFSFDDAMLISASIAKVWRDAMYERNNKLLAIKNATSSEELELIKW